MRRTLSRLLPFFQLTRLALVFTAIADSFTEMLLQARADVGRGVSLLPHVQPLRVLLVAIISVSLYAFGMSLNDIIDRRRDATLAPRRPLPSGRIGVFTAHVVAMALAVAALAAGGAYAALYPQGWTTFLLVVWTGTLITFYDAAGKYLVAPGLLTLGLIRFFHCLIPAPDVPLLWHPLFLFDHIVAISTIAYVWEDKRPTLTRGHLFGVFAGLIAVNGLSLAATLRTHSPAQLQALNPFPGLLLPLLAALTFVLLAWYLRLRRPTLPEAGRDLMLYGLLWLIVYDAAFALYYVGATSALAVLALLPIAYVAVQLMRVWTKVVSLTQRPEFERAR